MGTAVPHPWQMFEPTFIFLVFFLVSDEYPRLDWHRRATPSAAVALGVQGASARATAPRIAVTPPGAKALNVSRSAARFAHLLSLFGRRAPGSDDVVRVQPDRGPRQALDGCRNVQACRENRGPSGPGNTLPRPESHALNYWCI